MTSNAVLRLLVLVTTAPLLLPLAGCGCGEEPPPDEETPTAEPEPEVDYDRGYYIDMDLDSNGRVWVAYQNREFTSLGIGVATGDPAEWTHWDVEGQGEVVGGLVVNDFEGGYYATIAVDGNDVPHAAQWNKEDGELRYATRAGDEWQTEEIDDGNVGQYASIGVLAGEPIVAYHDYAAGALKVAIRTGGFWAASVVDEGDLGADAIENAVDVPNVGKFADLLVHSNGTVYIAYYDEANGNLKVASGTPGNWNVETWYGDGAGNAGVWPSLSEHNGNVWVAFQDLDAKDLLFGVWTGSEMNVDVIDSGDFVGADASVAWVGDRAAIMYHDGVNNDARLAVQDEAGAWSTETYMADGAVGFHNTLRADAAGRLNWTCFDHTRTEIVFQRFDL